VTLHDPAVAKLLPIESVQAFATYTNALISEPDTDHPGQLLNRIKELRHEWVGMGGEDSAGNTDRGAKFKGYLQLCLEGSGF